MTPRTPQQRADAILVALRAAPLAALYWWRAVPLEAHNEVCRHLGELALKRLMDLDNGNSDITTTQLEESVRSVWPENLPVEIEDALRRYLAALERRSTFRVVKVDN